MAASDVADLLAELVAIPSVNPGTHEPEAPTEGEARVAAFVRDFCEDLGLQVELQEVLPGRPNVIARLQVSDRPTLLLQTHMDVVSPLSDEAEAFTPKLRAGRMYGRGACDAKASLAAMLHALARAAQDPSPLVRSVVLAAAVDEEYRFRGVEAMVRSGLRADEVVVGEPTQLQIVVAHKGAMRWQMIVRGRAAHSARPELGDNAVYKMARLVSTLEEYAGELAEQPGEDQLGGPTLSVGVIRGGHMPNIVPDYCEILVDRRLVPGESFDHAEDHLQRFLQSRLGPDFAYEAQLILADLPLSRTHNRELAARAQRIVGEVLGEGLITCVHYGSDASKFAARGMPAILLGPGNIAQAHAADEWVDLQQVCAASEVYYRLMTRE